MGPFGPNSKKETQRKKLQKECQKGKLKRWKWKAETQKQELKMADSEGQTKKGEPKGPAPKGQLQRASWKGQTQRGNSTRGRGNWKEEIPQQTFHNKKQSKKARGKVRWSEVALAPYHLTLNLSTKTKRKQKNCDSCQPLSIKPNPWPKTLISAMASTFCETLSQEVRNSNPKLRSEAKSLTPKISTTDFQKSVRIEF